MHASPSKASTATWLDIYQCQTRLIWASEREVEPEFWDSPGTSGEQTMCKFIERGSMRVETKHDGMLEVKAGQWLFLSAEEVIQHHSPRSRIISIRFELLFRGGEAVFLRPRNSVLSPKKFPALKPAALELTEVFQRWGKSGTLQIDRHRIPLDENFRIESAFSRWLAAYTKAMFAIGEPIQSTRKRDSRVAKALALIEDHPMREKFREAELAASCASSVNHLARMFKREIGVSPFAYYERRRLAMASQALLSSKMSVKEIAFGLGFSSAPHFTNWFTKCQGSSPRAFRQNR